MTRRADTRTTTTPTKAPGPHAEGRRHQAERLAELLDRCAHGEDDAFAELYDLTVTRVYGTALRVLRARELALEVTQDVYLEVWRQSGRFTRERGTVLSWMITIAHRRSVDRVRATESQSRRDHVWGQLDADIPSDQVWETLQYRLDTDRVRHAMDLLSESQREALTLTYHGGYTQRQVAALLKVPLGTAKTRIRDGLSVLRRALEAPA